MRLLGFEITRAKAAPVLQSVPRGGGWWGFIGEPYAGAWQQNVEIHRDTVLCYSAVYACVTLIAADIAKMPVKLMAQDGKIWTEAESSAFSPVLRKPNHYQTRIKFFQQWVVSKLFHGNAYILKVRDDRGVVVQLYVLDPCRVRPLVSTTGDVFYELRRDDLSGLDQESVVVPAREIIHDMMPAFYHPLVGVSPIHACGLAATQGIRIQQNSAHFWRR
jgi:HK97 family phage portal protein